MPLCLAFRFIAGYRHDFCGRHVSNWVVSNAPTILPFFKIFLGSLLCGCIRTLENECCILNLQQSSHGTCVTEIRVQKSQDNRMRTTCWERCPVDKWQTSADLSSLLSQLLLLVSNSTHRNNSSEDSCRNFPLSPMEYRFFFTQYIPITVSLSPISFLPPLPFWPTHFYWKAKRLVRDKNKISSNKN